MTAGSVEFMPCRVPPMGMGAPPPVTIPAIPKLISKQRIKRNLFGSVEPGSTEALRRAEEKIKIEEWKIRFNVDLNVIKQTPLPLPNSISTKKSTSNKNETLPSLIELELKQHEERLALSEQKKEKCNLKIEKLTTVQQIQENAETTPQPQRNNNCRESKNNSTEISTISGSKQIRNSQCERSTDDDYLISNQNSNCNERVKPYARQRRITECFTVRKATSNLNGKQFIAKSLPESQKLWSELWQESTTIGSNNHHHHHHHQYRHVNHIRMQPTPTSITTTTTTDLISNNISSSSLSKT